MSATCGNCAFGRPGGWSPSGQNYVECHRRAPVVATASYVANGTWPTVTAGNWCGEHQPITEQVAG